MNFIELKSLDDLRRESTPHLDVFGRALHTSLSVVRGSLFVHCFTRAVWWGHREVPLPANVRLIARFPHTGRDRGRHAQEPHSC